MSNSVVLDLVCAQRRQMTLVLGLLIASGLFLGLSILFVGPGDESFPILVVDIVLVGSGLVLFGAIYRYCTKRAMND